MNIVMMGVQGAGKGTQCKMVSEALNLPHISTGDLFRANIGQGTDLGKKAQEYTNSGRLVPDSLVIDMVADRIQQEDAKNGFLLDGFPRSAVQLAATEYLCPIDKAILLDLDDQTAISRLGGRSECGKCGILYGANRKPKTAGVCDECSQPLKVRSDDQDVEAIKTRLAAYHNEIDNLVRYYQWKGVLQTINAGGTVDEVFAKVIAALKA